MLSPRDPEGSLGKPEAHLSAAKRAAGLRWVLCSHPYSCTDPASSLWDNFPAKLSMGQVTLSARNAHQEQNLLERGFKFHQHMAADAGSTCILPWVFCAATQERDPVITMQAPLAVLLSPVAVSLWE